MARAGLTRALVTTAAADLADEVGWPQLTISAVASRLGVRQPSLYKHIESLDALRRSVGALAIGELGDELLRAVAGRAGHDALVHLADAFRGWATAHPGRYAASVAAPAADDADSIRASDAILQTIAAVLRGYDPDDVDDARQVPVHTIRALRACLHGFVALEAAGGFGMPVDTDESFRRLVDGFDAALRLHIDTDRRPRFSPTSTSSTPSEVRNHAGFRQR